MIQRRVIFALSGLVVIGLGLGSRRFGDSLPYFVSTYAGDTLWAVMAFLGISCCVPHWSILQRSLLALLFAFSVEVSQLYHAPWIDEIRSTTLGALALGHGFLWSDLVCYTAGITGASITEYCLVARAESKKMEG